jgi:FkbM family methyltransferase
MKFRGQFLTDYYIHKYFPADYVGTAIDVGMAHPSHDNNTYVFEENGWNCLCVEPNPALYKLANGVRKYAENFACGSSNVDNVDFDVFTICDTNQTAISGLKPDNRLIESHRHLINGVEKIKVNVRTLDTLIANHSWITSIDFVSIDTENTELDILKGFDIAKWQPKLFVIENNYDEPFIAEYLSQFGYIRDQRIAVNDFYIKKS